MQHHHFTGSSRPQSSRQAPQDDPTTLNQRKSAMASNQVFVGGQDDDDMIQDTDFDDIQNDLQVIGEVEEEKLGATALQDEEVIVDFAAELMDQRDEELRIIQKKQSSLNRGAKDGQILPQMKPSKHQEFEDHGDADDGVLDKMLGLPAVIHQRKEGDAVSVALDDSDDFANLQERQYSVMSKRPVQISKFGNMFGTYGIDENSHPVLNQFGQLEIRAAQGLALKDRSPDRTHTSIAMSGQPSYRAQRTHREKPQLPEHVLFVDDGLKRSVTKQYQNHFQPLSIPMEPDLKRSKTSGKRKAQSHYTKRGRSIKVSSGKKRGSIISSNQPLFPTHGDDLTVKSPERKGTKSQKLVDALNNTLKSSQVYKSVKKLQDSARKSSNHEHTLPIEEESTRVNENASSMIEKPSCFMTICNIISFLTGPQTLETTACRLLSLAKLCLIAGCAYLFFEYQYVPLMDDHDAGYITGVSTVTEEVNQISVKLDSMVEPFHWFSWMTTDNLLRHVSESREFLCEYPIDKSILCSRITCEQELSVDHLNFEDFEFVSHGQLTPMQTCLKMAMGQSYCDYIKDVLEQSFCQYEFGILSKGAQNCLEKYSGTTNQAQCIIDYNKQVEEFKESQKDPQGQANPAAEADESLRPGLGIDLSNFLSLEGFEVKEQIKYEDLETYFCMNARMSFHFNTYDKLMGTFQKSISVEAKCELITLLLNEVSFTTAHFFFPEDWKAQLEEQVETISYTLSTDFDSFYLSEITPKIQTLPLTQKLYRQTQPLLKDSKFVASFARRPKALYKFLHMQTADEQEEPEQISTLLVSLKSPPAPADFFQEVANTSYTPADPSEVSLDLRKHCLYEDREGVQFATTDNLASVEGLELIEDVIDIVPLRQKVFKRDSAGGPPLGANETSKMFPSVVVSLNVIFRVQNQINHFAPLLTTVKELALRLIAGVVVLVFIYWAFLGRWLDLLGQCFIACKVSGYCCICRRKGDYLAMQGKSMRFSQFTKKLTEVQAALQLDALAEIHFRAKLLEQGQAGSLLTIGKESSAARGVAVKDKSEKDNSNIELVTPSKPERDSIAMKFGSNDPLRSDMQYSAVMTDSNRRHDTLTKQLLDNTGDRLTGLEGVNDNLARCRSVQTKNLKLFNQGKIDLSGASPAMVKRLKTGIGSELRGVIVEDLENEAGTDGDSLLESKTIQYSHIPKPQHTNPDDLARQFSKKSGLSKQEPALPFKKEQVEEIKQIVNSKIDKFHNKYLKPKIDDKIKKQYDFYNGKFKKIEDRTSKLERKVKELDPL